MRPLARAVVCACLLPVAVLVVDPSGYSPFGPSKWAAITVVGLVAVAMTAWGRRLRMARWPVAVWLGFLAWLVVAAAVGLDPVYAWVGTPERHFGVFTWVLCLLLFVVGQSLDDEGDARLVVGVGGIAGGIAGAWAVAEELGWRWTPVHGGSRIVGSMGSAAFLGAAMALVTPMALGVALDRSWARWLRVAAGGAAALAAAANVLVRHPLTGVGPEGYRIAFPEGANAHYVESYGVSPLPDRAHDSLLDVAVTTGLPGVGAYVVLLGLVAVFAARALRQGPAWLAGAAVGVVGYTAAGLVLFPLAELEPAVWFLAGVIVAQAARPEELIEIHSPRPVAAAVAALAVVAAIAGGRDVVADRATRSALAALARGDGPAAQRLAARAVGLRPDQLEYRLAAERAYAAPDTPSAIDRGLAQLADGLQVSPADPVLGDERGRLLLERALRSGSPADLAAARADLDRLVAANPFNAEDQLRLGVAAARSGDDRTAERAWLAADRLAPTSPSAPTDLATLYARQGRWPEAAVAARRALTRDASDVQAGTIVTQSVGHLGT